MSKWWSVIGICILVILIVSVSGCFEDKKSEKENNIDKFIGTWVGEWDWGNNVTSNETWIFYEDGTIKIEDNFGTESGTYGLDGDRLKIKIPTSAAKHPDAVSTSWYDYEFSNDDTTLKLESTFNKVGYFEKQS
jgi:hypothetical protein